ncbi:MAG: alpha/beta hydrolase, partial [Dehalococcoidia bacterium]|nr:alpha/beta hydrolase [Dehalococcoidia bacterium]
GPQLKQFPGSETIDIPGNGKGKLLPTVEENVEWLRAYVSKGGHKDLVLAGHGLGGAMALSYALKYPQDVKALILMSTGAKLKVHPSHFMELEEATTNKNIWKSLVEQEYRQVCPDVKNAVIKKATDAGPKQRLEDLECCNKFDVLEKVSAIHIPTLIIAGSEDKLTPPKFSEALAEKIPGSKLLVIQGAAHYPFMEKPAEVNKAMADFLAGISN